MGRVDWLKALDLKQALVNCHNDFVGDWYRDPWGWPECDWVLGKSDRLVHVVSRLNSTGVSHTARLDVAKENFGIRPAIIMDPIDRLCYQAIVDSLSLRLIGGMERYAYGWRLPRRTRRRRRGHYRRQDWEWALFREHLVGLGVWSNHGLKTDVVQYFASIPIPRLEEEIFDRASGGVAERLVNMLQGFDSIHGRAGLPQRSAASAVLANMYMAPIDEVLRRFRRVRGLVAKFAPFGSAIRWMDDIWVFGGEGRLRATQVDLHERMRDRGLNLNLGKTKLLSGTELRQEVMRLEHSAVDGDLGAKTPTLTPINDLIDRLLDEPSATERTSIRFVTTRMRDHEVFGRVGEFSDKAHLMPHASDALARLFRDSGAWRDLQNWYSSYASGLWGRIDWAVAQFGTMFPSGVAANDQVQDLLATSLLKGRSHALSGLAAQRLAAWKASDARELIREAASVAEHPHDRRALALAGTAAKMPRSELRGLLSEFRENRVTLEMLEDTSFAKVKVKADFDGA